MYKSPIEIFHEQLSTQLEGETFRAVQRVGINVDKEELLKALQYDRGQYEEGFRDGERHTLRQIKNLLPEWLYEAIKENLIKAGEQE